MTQNLQRYYEALAPTPFFSDFEEDELRRLIEACDPKVLAAREPLWAVGSTGDSAYILIEGRLEKTRRLPPDGKQVDQFRDSGHTVGMSYLVKEWTHSSTATALERTELLQLERKSFQKLLDAEDTAAFRLIDKLAEELVDDMREANRRLHQVFGNPAETLRTLRRRVRGG